MSEHSKVKDGELCRKEFEAWYCENVSPCFAGEHVATYHDAHARQALLSQLAIAMEALTDIFEQYPNPELNHVDYRVHAARCAEQALKSLSLDNEGERV